MRSLLNPVLVNGFGFAVIADDGRVLFHSDPEHNLSENFFAETDQSRRLRALVAAKHSELINISYWGDGHRAYVTSMNQDGFPWSLVTFYDQQILDTVNLEWFITTVAFILIYCSFYAIVGMGTILLRPTYRVPWLWPDPARSSVYLRLFWSYVLFAAAWAGCTPVLRLAGAPLDRLRASPAGVGARFRHATTNEAATLWRLVLCVDDCCRRALAGARLGNLRSRFLDVAVGVYWTHRIGHRSASRECLSECWQRLSQDGTPSESLIWPRSGSVDGRDGGSSGNYVLYGWPRRACGAPSGGARKSVLRSI